MSDSSDTPVSHTDLYHKLGRLEALIETMMASVNTFQGAIKDLHARIDSLEARQGTLEKRRATDYGGLTVLIGLFKDFAIPVAAILVAWMVASNRLEQQLPHNQPPAQRSLSQHG
jgi:hypothetical protein